MTAVVYATIADITEYLGGADLLAISDRDGSGVIDEPAIGAALADASSLIDSYIFKFLPIAYVDAPLALRRHAMAIATYSLANNAETDDQRKRYEDAIAWLRDVAKGLVSIAIPPVDDSPSTSGGTVSYFTAERRLSRDSLRGCL